MYRKYEHDYMYPVQLPNGKLIYRLEAEEADEVKAAIKQGAPIPPKRSERLVPFGTGIKKKGDMYCCTFQDMHIGDFDTLEAALDAWDDEERAQRYQIQQDEEMEALDARYYGNLRFDEDGYKIFTPQPSVK